MVNEDDLPCAHQSLRDHQGPDDVIGDDTPGIADDVRIAMVEPQHLEDVHAAVHARDNGEVPTGTKCQPMIGKLRDELLIMCD